jgi:ABC-type transport system substrate-binding protein
LPCNGGVSVDPLSLKGFFGTQASSNWACLDDPVLDQLIADAEQAGDMDSRNELIKQIQVHLMENAYEVPIVELAFYTGLKDRVKGIRFDATSFYPWLYEAYILP